MGWGEVWHFTLMLILLTGTVLWEFFAMAFPDRGRDQAFGVVWGLLVACSLFFDGFAPPELWLGLVAIMGFIALMFADDTLDARLYRTAMSWLGVVYIGYLLPHWVLLFRLPDGRSWAIFVLVVVCIGDSAAYFVGRVFGKRKLAPSISPGKSVEGALANVVFSTLTAIATGVLLLPEQSMVVNALLGIVLSVLGQCGDLFESWIKRVFAVKDSGTWFPGHGGFLDRVDSLIFPAVFMTTYIRVLHP